MDPERFVNEQAAVMRRFVAVNSQGMHASIAGLEQPRRPTGHRASDMPWIRIPLLALLSLVSVSLTAQAPPPGAAGTSTVSSTMRPALAQVAQTLTAINSHRWKAPTPVRDEVDGDISSIQRDLNGTLAGLLQQAEAAPASVPAAFAVYRNVDALYDTLLRVVETAELAAPDNEQAQLEAALKNLEAARSSLGDSIQSGSQTELAEVTRLRTAVAAAAVAQRTPVKTTVVDDGPTATKPRKKRPTPTKSSTNSSSQPANPSQQPASPQ
jgi:hypothetical protein